MIDLMWAAIVLQGVSLVMQVSPLKQLGKSLWAFGVKAWFLSFIALIIERFIT